MSILRTHTNVIFVSYCARYFQTRTTAVMMPQLDNRPHQTPPERTSINQYPAAWLVVIYSQRGPPKPTLHANTLPPATRQSTNLQYQCSTSVQYYQCSSTQIHNPSNGASSVPLSCLCCSRRLLRGRIFIDLRLSP